ncbi:MAG: hypothetical protein TR69_WS6001000062 [candidate division WS6 bacterium OLB20]|uniref:Uncharacterized protein n=1 Tax=candidate division WS6 bacterium OLB20 TaxID=1617426 RepID=A0A136M125_9BACT|nr:MAG: hypothetical protein TR69_WS6001000062 [candidate division WS6 bacterium OLB20]
MELNTLHRPDAQRIVTHEPHKGMELKTIAEPLSGPEQIEELIPGFSEAYSDALNRVGPLVYSDPGFVHPALFFCDDAGFNRYLGRALADSNSPTAEGGPGNLVYSGHENAIYIRRNAFANRVKKGGWDREFMVRGIVEEMLHAGSTFVSPDGTGMRVGFYTVQADGARIVDSSRRLEGGLYAWHTEAMTPEELAEYGDVDEYRGQVEDPLQIAFTEHVTSLLGAMLFDAQPYNKEGDRVSFSIRLADGLAMGVGSFRKEHLRAMYSFSDMTFEQRLYATLQAGTLPAFKDFMIDPLNKLKYKHFKRLSQQLKHTSGQPISLNDIQNKMIPSLVTAYGYMGNKIMMVTDRTIFTDVMHRRTR